MSDDEQGYAPASYLEPVEGKTSLEEHMEEGTGQGEKDRVCRLIADHRNRGASTGYYLYLMLYIRSSKRSSYIIYIVEAG